MKLWWLSFRYDLKHCFFKCKTPNECRIIFWDLLDDEQKTRNDNE